MSNQIRNQRLVQYLHLYFLSYFLLTSCIYATTNPIDGRTNIQYETTNWVLRNTDYALGFVKLNNGVTILGGSGATFNITEPISCGLDLRETGTILLQGDLYFDSNFTITSNGTICGNEHSIIMCGDLTLSDSNYVRVLHVNTNTIIDGQGHSLILGKRAKLFVDDNVTLTLRNMVIKPTFNYYSDPCIKLATSRSKLALDNVKFDLVQDFDFITGQLFVYNDVAITGTSAFVYHSTQPSLITSDATLYFDLGTTFSVAPATFTAYPYTISSPYVLNNFIQMADQTSKLYLNGCSLLSTLTGCRFTNGTINFENKVLINSSTAPTISPMSSVTPVASIGVLSNPKSLAWSPDGKYLAIVGPAGMLQIFTFDGINTLVQIGSSVAVGGVSYSVSWSNDGRFIAVINIDTNRLRIFSFSGDSSPIQVGSDVSAGNFTNAATWSPDGRFIATVAFSDNSLHVYSFDGVHTPTLVATTGTFSGPFEVSWSPDGRYIGIVVFNSNGIQVFSFDGVATLQSVSTFTPSGANSIYPIGWSPDSRFVAFGDWETQSLWVCSFDGVNGLNLVGNKVSVYGGDRPQSLGWSPDGKFIVVGCLSGSLDMFSFDGVNTPVHVNGSYESISSGNNATAWSPNGKFIAFATADNTLSIFGVNYIVDRSTQAMSNGIVFGNSALGPSYDPAINILGDAYVQTYGLVNYDCVN